LVPIAAFGQESGNRIYGNNGYYYQPRRQPQSNGGTLGNNSYGYPIEASVLTNLKPDAFVAVFGITEASAPALERTAKVNARVTEFTGKLNCLGITTNDIFVDFSTQNRVYDFTVNGSEAREKLTGFETKKTVAVRYKNRYVFEPIVRAAAATQIFDLIK